MGKQASLFQRPDHRYGGSLRRKFRHARPLPRRASLHLVVKSTRAKGAWSFNHRRNRPIVSRLLTKFSARFGVKILRAGISSNHFHLHLAGVDRLLYRRFIRALTSALALAITGHSRSRKVLNTPFFDQRPFSRIVAEGRRAFAAVSDYVDINRMEGLGIEREAAELFVKEGRGRRAPSPG